MDAALLIEVDRWAESLGTLLPAPKRPISAGEPDRRAIRALLHWVLSRMFAARGVGSLPLPTGWSAGRAIEQRLSGSGIDFGALAPEAVGTIYERLLDRPARAWPAGPGGMRRASCRRKSTGAYYTPPALVDDVVPATLSPLLNGAMLCPHGCVLAPGPAQTKPPASAVLPNEPVRIVDPACGSGCLLLGAYRFLLRRQLACCASDEAASAAGRVESGPDGLPRLTLSEKLRILSDCIHGVDADELAVELTRQSLLLVALEGAPQFDTRAPGRPELSALDLSVNIRHGNALIARDVWTRPRPVSESGIGGAPAVAWEQAFPHVFRRANPGFDAVVANPPWGQKEVKRDPEMIAYLRSRFRSLRGIFDAFRPFVEKGIELLRAGGRFGMVLPDTVLLKNYVETRRIMLEQLCLDRIDWWGMRFPGAAVDVATIIGTRGSCPADHAVRCASHHDARRGPGANAASACQDGLIAHDIPQADFGRNERLTFNLHLTPARRRVLEHLSHWPRLGDLCEVHEGVHSGNMRAELFVDRRLDESCQRLLLGRGEIAPYALRWTGRFVRLSALPFRRTGGRYANAGRPRWFDCEKVLVRRTGDFVLAAVDREHLYASNNFFVVVPKATCGAVDRVDLDVVCAVLNSRLITWYFRTIEPRVGRVYAELKIKHLARFPMPDMATSSGELAQLRGLSRERAGVAQALLKVGTSAGEADLSCLRLELDQAIARLVNQIFDIETPE